MATFPSQKPSSNVEGSSIRRVGRNYGGSSRAVSSIATGILTGRYFKDAFGVSSSSKPASSFAPSGGSRERSAEDWYNESLMKDYDLKRETKRRRGTLADGKRFAGDGRTMKGASADGKGGFKLDWENAPVQPATPAPTPIKPGNQFTPAKKTTGRKATHADTRKAVTAGHITAEEGIQISPTYAKKYAAREAAKQAKREEKQA